ncbi:MAG: hypothetical protein ACYDGS_09505 [Thermoleophilia bacterium]
MSKLALTGLAGLVILLLGAGVVFAQGGPSIYGGGMRGMMNTTASPGTQGTQTTPGNGTYGPGMMGNSNGNGISMMSNGNWDEMRDAMSNGNWDGMVNVCRDTINSYRQGTDNSQATPQTSAPARDNTGTTGTSNPSTATTSRTRSMMGSRI